MNHKLDTDKQVFFYEQEFYVLSNFSSFRLEWRGSDFDTAEHAYQWSKFLEYPVIQDKIKASRSAHEAYKIAQDYKGKEFPGWDIYKVEVMRNILLAKVHQHPYVLKKLMETGSRTLIEDSWRDDYWGWGENKSGDNMLGKLWMEIRDTGMYTP